MRGPRSWGSPSHPQDGAVALLGLVVAVPALLVLALLWACVQCLVALAECLG